MLGPNIFASLPPYGQKALDAIPAAVLFGVTDLEQVNEHYVTARVVICLPFSDRAQTLMYARYGLRVISQNLVPGDRVGDLAEAYVEWRG